jgi:putative ABC transport system ATP-binding protein
MGELIAVCGASREVSTRPLWRGLTFTVTAGQRLVVQAPSGSGKTLLLRAIAGLDRFTTGSCEFRGQPQSEWSMPDYRAQVMYLPQRAAFASGTVLAALRAPFGFGAHRHKVFDPAAAEQMLAELGRPARLLETATANLSGGELQSVLLARALLLNPTVLLLDEVTSALDAELVRQVERVLISWSQAEERALLWVGHDRDSQSRIGTDELRIAEEGR